MIIDETFKINRGVLLMNHNLVKKSVLCLAIGFLIICFSNNAIAGGSVSIKLGKGSDSDRTPVAKKHKKQGPPAHAPAYGYRAKHHYLYYPCRSVYYDTGRGLYFYMKGDNWEVGASLPNSLRIGLGDSVSIELDTDKPYIHHKDHKKMYPPEASNSARKKNKNS